MRHRGSAGRSRWHEVRKIRKLVMIEAHLSTLLWQTGHARQACASVRCKSRVAPAVARCGREGRRPGADAAAAPADPIAPLLDNGALP